MKFIPYSSANIWANRVFQGLVISSFISAPLLVSRPPFSACRSPDGQAHPKYLISDQGSQFVSSEFRTWCNSNEIKQRFGAIGKHGSIAVTERAILTYKNGCTRRILVPISRTEMVEETRLFFEWYNEHRPHMFLRGKTPNEVYFGRHAANAKPRIETRPFAKHKTPCASPRMCIAGKAGAKVRVRLEFLGGRLHLSILKVERI